MNRLLCLGFAATALLITLAAAYAVGEEHPKGDHLRYQSNYADAMLEARIRNVPIYFVRHKDN